MTHVALAAAQENHIAQEEDNEHGETLQDLSS